MMESSTSLKYSDTGTLSEKKLSYKTDFSYTQKNEEEPFRLKGTLPNLKGSKLKDNISKIRSFKSLADNWNYNGAAAISESVVNNALDIVKILHHQPDVFPTGRNSIQFEYEQGNRYLEIEIFEHEISILIIIDDDEHEGSISFQDYDDVSEIVKAFYA